MSNRTVLNWVKLKLTCVCFFKKIWWLWIYIYQEVSLIMRSRTVLNWVKLQLPCGCDFCFSFKKKKRKKCSFSPFSFFLFFFFFFCGWIVHQERGLFSSAVDAPDGFLHEWWVIFYDMFRSRKVVNEEPDEGSSVVVMISSVC